MIGSIFVKFMKLPQQLRFIVIGVLNTWLGLGVFTCVYFLLIPFIHYTFVFGLSSVLSTSFAYVLLKTFVFQTKGNVWTEYFKCQFNYGVIACMNLILLVIFVEFLQLKVLIAQVIIVALLAVLSFFLHKYITFRSIL